MASKSSAHHTTQNYIGTRRGRSSAGDIGWEMFPEKIESTRINENPDQLDDMWRDTLKDMGPENSRLFAYEEPRRRNHGNDVLNLRAVGSRYLTEPWQNEDYDTQFHDKDPRGHLTEVPWKEFRRVAEAHLRQIDLKDDADYSTTGGGIHPNTLYRQIRASQNWIKARLKIFETSYENRHSGGVGVYDHVSDVFKSEYEDTSVLVDGTGMSQTFEDPINRARATSILSNWVHGGSTALTANSTTDHKVPVAAYGKLLRQRGLIPHETQLRLIEDDTKWLNSTTMKQSNPIVKMMSSAVAESTAIAETRKNKQSSTHAAADTVKYNSSYDSKQGENRNNILTRDIVALLGITETEIKKIESYALVNRKQADLMLANLYNMAEVVHNAPAHVKFIMRDELLMSRAGLKPASANDIRSMSGMAVVNPKIIQHMDMMVRKNPDQVPTEEILRLTIGDPEQKLNKNPHELFVSKNRARNTDDIMRNKRTPVDHKITESLKVYSYKSLNDMNITRNRVESKMSEQFFADATSALQGKNKSLSTDNFYETMLNAEIDNAFGDNLAKNRSTGKMGTKYLSRHQARDDLFGKNEIKNISRKVNSK